ncbi:Uncharacterised protein [Vibrio cholerae]|nr:Uncharacterised protein [Vibrio cholerae]CSC64820.1 Uncharacterised protein [Vibrio cholerae]CSI51552.1 Uncharacterised protein [Vibrio cholerae]CSI60883.1 Uncharacterised protein [Vibrio cholerae]
MKIRADKPYALIQLTIPLSRQDKSYREHGFLRSKSDPTTSVSEAFDRLKWLTSKGHYKAG